MAQTARDMAKEKAQNPNGSQGNPSDRVTVAPENENGDSQKTQTIENAADPTATVAKKPSEATAKPVPPPANDGTKPSEAGKKPEEPEEDDDDLDGQAQKIDPNEVEFKTDKSLLHWRPRDPPKELSFEGVSGVIIQLCFKAKLQLADLGRRFWALACWTAADSTTTGETTEPTRQKTKIGHSTRSMLAN